MKSDVIIWGGSGHAKVVADILELQGRWRIIGLIEDRWRGNPATYDFTRYPLLGDRTKLEDLKCKGIEYIIVAIGDCTARLALAQFATSSGFKLATAVHPSATVARDVKLGAGSVVVAAAVVAPGTTIGENVIVNTSASVDHECLIGNGVHLSPGVRLGGRVTVEAGTWIGLGAVVRDRVRIGPNSIIGAGAVVLDDIPARVVSYGIPSRVIRAIPE